MVIAISAASVAVGRMFEPGTPGDQVASFAGILGAMAAVLLFHARRADGWGVLGMGRPKRWWVTLLLVVPVLVVSMLLLGLFQTLVVMPLTGGAEADATRFESLEGNTPRFVLGLCSVWITAAFGEELVYRGFMLHRVSRLLGGTTGAWWGALIVSSAVFGLIHLYQGLPGVLMTGAAGLLLGATYLLARRNLWLCMLVHGLMDTVAFTAIYLGQMPQ